MGHIDSRYVFSPPPSHHRHEKLLIGELFDHKRPQGLRTLRSISLCHRHSSCTAFVSSHILHPLANITKVCQWKGITCDTSGNINVVAITNEGLEGTLPSKLGQLTTLTELYLGSNAFTGTIPSQLVALPKIKTLDLSLNKSKNQNVGLITE